MASHRGRIEVPTCSFCGKRHDEVNKLIAGPDVNICDECVDLCADIVREDRGRKRWSRQGSKRYLWLPRDLDAAVHYVVYEQGKPMEVYVGFPDPEDYRRNVHGPW